MLFCEIFETKVCQPCHYRNGKVRGQITFCDRASLKDFIFYSVILYQMTYKTSFSFFLVIIKIISEVAYAFIWQFFNLWYANLRKHF